MMHGAFLIFAEKYFQFFIRLFWCFSLHDPHTIHHTMNMGIDADKRHIIKMGENDFCCFDTHSGESLDSLEIMGNFSSVFVYEFFCCQEKMSCFYSVIIYSPQHHFDFFVRNFEKIGWSLDSLKEFFCCSIHTLIGHLR